MLFKLPDPLAQLSGEVNGFILLSFEIGEKRKEAAFSKDFKLKAGKRNTGSPRHTTVMETSHLWSHVVTVIKRSHHQHDFATFFCVCGVR